MLSGVEHEKGFITSERGKTVIPYLYVLSIIGFHGMGRRVPNATVAECTKKMYFYKTNKRDNTLQSGFNLSHIHFDLSIYSSYWSSSYHDFTIEPVSLWKVLPQNAMGRDCYGKCIE